MPGIGHLLVGMAAGRLHTPRPRSGRVLAMSMGAYAALASCPDLDVVAFTLGIPYDAPLGHRGAMHSLPVGLALGLTFGGIARLLGQPWLRTTLLACAVACSHGLLDSFTNGGEGIALLWPWSAERFFSPWRPIPVAPLLPTAWFTAGGIKVLATELLLFGPLALVALWRRGRPPGPGA